MPETVRGAVECRPVKRVRRTHSVMELSKLSPYSPTVSVEDETTFHNLKSRKDISGGVQTYQNFIVLGYK